ncbi:MAG: tRNA(Ile)-lysidine synthase [Patescibacteria group bacterium]|nr:tRNA(Ile)-lysidine synthase [Patescibacteria group bacterium]
MRNRIRNRIIPEIETFNPGFTTTALRFAEYAAELDAHLETEVTEYLESEEEPETLEIARFATLSPFLKKDILSRLYVRKNSSGIGLSEGMVAEMLRFCSMKYGGKAKVFGKLELTRKKGKISYRKNREA